MSEYVNVKDLLGVSQAINKKLMDENGILRAGFDSLHSDFKLVENERDALRAELAEMTADRDSEERWANEYHAQVDALSAELAQAREALRRIANSAGPDGTGYTSGEGHSDCVWIARAALSGGA